MSTVAVVIPSRNMAPTLGRAIESAAGADEIHVIDDASTDETGAVLARVPLHIHVWRWPMKSRCHLAAMRVVYEASRCEHIIGMGADDVLRPGFVDAVREHADAGVVFSDYDVVDEAGNFLLPVSQQVTTTTTLTPEEMNARMRSDRNATETGIGSSLRRDVAEWLWRHGWHELGPHMDSIGYATAACMFGCVLLPMVGAAYTMTDSSYGRDNVRKPDDIKRWGAACREFMYRVGLPDATARALGHKRCHVIWS